MHMDAPPGKNSAVDRSQGARKREPPLRRRRVAEQVLIVEITNAARCIAEARDWGGEPVFRTDGVWRVLTTVARSTYCLAIADLGRPLRVRKQVARELAHAAVRARLIDLESNPQDKRILQLRLTSRGRAELAAARTAEAQLLMTLLNGLGDRELATAAQVVTVIRQRLERDAREWARIKAERARS